ncbi:hypothetical protein HZB97_01605, partial [Candidatus Gottesmanbacteria bacterium]|nr:hypothetical protein [Candidatus Gottesmanbacteria bacterium]
MRPNISWQQIWKRRLWQKTHPEIHSENIPFSVPKSRKKQDWTKILAKVSFLLFLFV